MGSYYKSYGEEIIIFKGKILSIGGRLTLLKASLSSLPIYFMSIFPVPTGVVDKITEIQRKFFWCGSMDSKGLPLMAWSILQLPKNLDGST